MKHCIFSIMLLLLLGSVAMAQRQVNVVLTNGTQQQYVVQESGVVAFADESTIVVRESVSSTPVTFAIDDIRKITFGSALGIDDVQSASAMHLFPNPARDIVNVEGVGQHDVVLYTMSGHEVLRQTVNGTAQLDLRGVAAGIYFVVADGRVSKLVKMK
ncbi:MAG: T9SS type A sorting domain-containing protein [Bacteroidales bacterium]|nr:T9SS type A sorting domain-containing protein [Bacteroidales bacterium]